MLAVALLISAQPAQAATITVATTTDETAVNGQCSLREAIINANNDAATNPDCAAGSGADTIILPAGTYTLTIAGSDSLASQTAGTTVENPAVGDLDITGTLTINGAGQSTTIVQAGADTASAIDRIFDSRPSSTLTLTNMTVRNGNAPSKTTAPQFIDFGGAIRSDGRLTLDNVTVGASRTQGPGGGIFASGTGIAATNITVSGNNAGNYGGGIAIQANSGTSTLTNVTANGNTALTDGGGVTFLSAGDLVNSTVSGNTALRGGGVSVREGPVNITASTINGNTATGSNASGGGISITIDLSSNALTVTNSTITGNTVNATAGTANGGGIARTGASSNLTLQNVTVDDNGATNGANVFFTGAGTAANATARNTIIANPRSGTNCNISFATATNDLSSDATCFPTGLGNLLSANPLLGALANNGGPTQTKALGAGSPAIDAGAALSCPATDQRGVARPQGAGCDIGAFEAGAGPPVVPELSTLVMFGSGLAGLGGYALTRARAARARRQA